MHTLALLAMLAGTPARAEISTDTVRSAVATLSSDEFEGRAPASEGEKKTLAYLTERFKALGTLPGNPDGTYLQKVPMIGATITSKDAKLLFSRGKDALKLSYADDYMAVTKHLDSKASFDAPLVFVGYGVEAPEYGWDDFKGMDVKGKVLVMLINDPPVADPKDPSKLDPAVFGGKAMTYYGRWTYKYEKAAEKGAAGVLIVHETEPAAYPWEVVRNSWGGENFDLESPEAAKRAAIEGWITRDRAVELFKLAGLDFDAQKKAAVSRDFKPVELGVKASLALENKIRRIESANVLAKVAGTDPKLKDEYVVYMAHWDHLGMRTGPNGKKEIFHGAADNASGTGGLLALAQSFAKAKPRRSILFLATTGEEQGLLGSAYYAENPLYPLDKTAAAINMDVLNVLGPTKDVTLIGYGQSELDEIVKRHASQQGRVVKPDPQPEKGGFYRSDHLSFAKKGVPCLDMSEGIEYVGKPEGWGLAQRDEYEEKRYHKPEDVILPSWDLSGTALDLTLLYQVGLDVADAERGPAWNPKSEFAALRRPAPAAKN
jgi:Zn-dependent M28 family amino/carboxypeptidase